jgi:tripartite-type tricarboxylate transporter receptor subunit TctC
LKIFGDKRMQKITRRLGLATLALAMMTAFGVHAQDYPNKPIKIIAPFPTGTGPDANTREIALELSKALGQSVVVENRPMATPW